VTKLQLQQYYIQQAHMLKIQEKYLSKIQMYRKYKKYEDELKWREQDEGLILIPFKTKRYETWNDNGHEK
jgi:hypothetical protein